MYIEYDKEEMEYLKGKDEKLGKVIDYIGIIKERINPDLFSAMTYHILGQQISARVQDAIYERLEQKIGTVTPEKVKKLGREGLRELGMSYRKADTILRVADEMISGRLDIEKLKELSDDEVIKELSKIKGIGPWTAEMILMFTLTRPDVFTFLDIALKRGLKMIYGHEEISRELFEEYRKLFSPYCSVASLYIWAVGEEKVEGIADFVKSFQET